MLTPRQLFLRHQAQTSDTPLLLEVERAEGVWMYGPAGQRYLDLISGIGVSNVGHRHPRVLAAIQQQLDKYLHLMVYGELVQTPQAELAHALHHTLPAHLDNVYLVNSGTEAVEGALKLAKRHTGRTELVSCLNAYHGSTQGALSVSGSENFKRSFRPLLPDVRHIRYNATEDLAQITERTAAVIVETVQGEAGIRVPENDYLQHLRRRCTEVGALLILDEIQCGFGRTGTFWAFEQFGIAPDILLCAKGMGGGMPIGAFIAPQAMMHGFKSDPVLGHLTTFGGHPVSCAAALATLRVIQDEGLLADVAAKAARFRSQLVHPAIRGVRGLGLLMAVEFDSYAVLKPIIDHALAHEGVLTDWFLFCDNSLRLAPPLTISAAEIDWACAALLRAIEHVTGQPIAQ
ncbi:aspartate aminotransferase family protein [Hymenobacter busanensis]|uniref:Aspartate aminotransferase family protein n=1 Tax=Hymenobacter busanensis TaxID=2607656 RepID=A0A7L4ZSZ6_9BACT|nr:aspartate aminotransferase family protein [Hymenobacter busanensis]KAA9327604.1 aspartate aminotransferase family protein [Hymenobacter busanensis]QHJ06057.1 aminotransferase class III-fold pyridoxal phosphate-dependent enzyme [Hymenobacter busanensis]